MTNQALHQRQPWRIVHSEASLGWGGQEHRILAELDGFHRRGHDVWLVAPEQSGVFRRASQAGISVKAQRFDQRLLLPLHVVRMASWLRRHRIQIVNTHSSRDGWMLTLASRIAHVPLVIRSRHFDVPIPNKSLSRLVYKEWTHHVITTSERITEKLLETFEMNPDEVTTMTTGVDLDRFRPEGPRAELPLPPLPAGTPLIGMISVIRHAKGAQILAEAARLLRYEGRDVAWFACGHPAGDAHAGDTETSVLLHLTPGDVRLTDAAPGNRAPIAELLAPMRAGGVAAVSANGVLGDPTTATAARGADLVGAFTSALVSAVARWDVDDRGLLRGGAAA